MYFVEPRESGAWEPDTPAAQIRLLTFVPVGQVEKRRIAQVMQQRLSVTAGAGEVGIDFFLGRSGTPTRISVTADADDTPAETATALLAALSLALPSGVTAGAGPTDVTVDITGSVAQPWFASRSVASSRLAVTTLFERWATLRCEWSRMAWRVQFRAAQHRGFSSAMALASKAKLAVDRALAPNVRAAGWRFAGTLAMTQVPEQDRSESSVALDFALEGYSTEAIQVVAMRRAGIEIVAA